MNNRLAESGLSSASVSYNWHSHAHTRIMRRQKFRNELTHWTEWNVWVCRQSAVAYDWRTSWLPIHVNIVVERELFYSLRSTTKQITMHLVCRTNTSTASATRLAQLMLRCGAIALSRNVCIPHRRRSKIQKRNSNVKLCEHFWHSRALTL